MTDKLLLTTSLGRAVESEDFEHNRISGDEGELVKEVVLVLIGPSVNVIRLDLDLEGPVRLSNLVAVLIPLGEFHNRHGTGMVRNLVQMLADRLSSAGVLHLTKDVRPSVLEEVEGSLSVEGEHDEPVSGGHAISKELHAVTWSGVSHVGDGSCEFGDSHDGVLAALEDTGVWGVVGRDVLHQCGGANGMGSLDPAFGHGVGDSVEGQVHILLEEGLKLLTNEELLGSIVHLDHSPDHR